jgi:hypothetical protein
MPIQPDEIMRNLTALADAIASALRSNPVAREAARQLGSWLLHAVEDQPTESASVARDVGGEAGTAALPHRSSSAAPVPIIPIASPEPIHQVELNIGGLRRVLEVPGTPQEAMAAQRAAQQRQATTAPLHARPFIDEGPPPDLSLVMKRARLKSEACRWAITRRRRLAEEPTDFETAIKPHDVDLSVRARSLRDCYLWTLDPYASLPGDEALQQIAACYDNLVAGAELALEVFNDTNDENGFHHDAYQLLAEAQSGLRNALEDVDVKRDQDQQDVFVWLKRRTVDEQIYIERHMRLDDPADPAQWMELASRIGELRTKYQRIRQEERERRRLLNKAQYHASRIAGNPPEEARGDWNTLVHALDSLLKIGIPPSDTAIRELLLPVIDAMPEDLAWPNGTQRIVEEIDRYVASREALRLEQTPAPREPSPQVREVANLLRGKVIVLIGGQRRQQSLEALQRAFELDEVRWIASAPHESLFTFEPSIARPETALVLLAIRWASHSFEGVKAICERYGKPFVRLPGGYNPNQVAAQILAQADESLSVPARLAGSARPA